MNLTAILSSGLATGALFALLAMGLQLAYSATDILNFAHGEIVMGGAFCYLALTSSAHVSGWFSLLLVTVLGAVAGAVAYFVLRTFSARSAISASIASIAISFALQGLYQFVFGSEKKVAQPLLSGDQVHLLGAVVPRQNLIIIALALVFVAVLAVIMGTSRLGLAIRATAGNLMAARGVGISVTRTQAVVFGLGGALAFAAGGAVAPITGAGFNAGQALMVSAFVATVLGGLGSLWMAGVGGVVLGVLEAALGSTPAGSYTQTALFGLLMIILLVRPGGLAGQTGGAR